MITQEEGALLLKVARSAIEGYFRKKSPFLPPKGKYPFLWEKRGAFVTVKTEGRLRGCIGRVTPADPLVETVAQVAAEAAFNDPRFPPLTEAELPAVSLEVSLLTPLTKISDIETIQVGRDGLLVQKGGAAGLLLPQVAAERNWLREEFLAHTCSKAGLPSEAWKEKGTEIYTFRAEIFSEASRG